MQIGTVGEELGVQECYALLRTVPIGRLVATRHALPLVLPVHFALDGSAVVLRTGGEEALIRATRDAVVSLQADRLDPDSCSGWSVVVTGMASPMTSPDEVLRAAALNLGTWFPGPGDCFARIVPGLVTGRRLVGSCRRLSPTDARRPGVRSAAGRPSAAPSPTSPAAHRQAGPPPPAR
jgi:uncharacterized protein